MDAVHIFNIVQKFWHAEMTQKFCEAFVGLGIVLHNEWGSILISFSLVFGELLFRFLLLLSNIRNLKPKLVCSLISSKSGQSILNGLMVSTFNENVSLRKEIKTIFVHFSYPSCLPLLSLSSNIQK